MTVQYFFFLSFILLLVGRGGNETIKDMLIGNKNWTLSHTVIFDSLHTKPEAAMTERKKERNKRKKKKEMN